MPLSQNRTTPVTVPRRVWVAAPAHPATSRTGAHRRQAEDLAHAHILPGQRAAAPDVCALPSGYGDQDRARIVTSVTSASLQRRGVGHRLARPRSPSPHRMRRPRQRPSNRTAQTVKNWPRVIDSASRPSRWTWFDGVVGVHPGLLGPPPVHSRRTAGSPPRTRRPRWTWRRCAGLPPVLFSGSAVSPAAAMVDTASRGASHGGGVVRMTAGAGSGARTHPVSAIIPRSATCTATTMAHRLPSTRSRIELCAPDGPAGTLLYGPQRPAPADRPP